MNSYIEGQLADQRRLKDEEFEQKANLHAQELQSNREKLASLDPTKDAKEYADTQNALRQNFTDIRELYHPEKNPGAIARFGHIVTDALKLTNPKKRIEGMAAQREAGIQKDERQAQGVVASLPLSPERKSITGSTDRCGYQTSINASNDEESSYALS